MGVSVRYNALARFEARALVVKATVEQFPAVDLAFAWTQDKYAPLILGHMVLVPLSEI